MKFIIYDKQTGEIIVGLKDLPDNTDYSQPRGDVYYKGRLIIGGVNWEVCDYKVLDPPIDVEFEAGKYMYQNGNVIENPNYNPDILEE